MTIMSLYVTLLGDLVRFYKSRQRKILRGV